ncbi:hypothetical protein [Rufibacter roseus]|uniref:Lipoprotein n=1 Tax=Rufibacter roseus TaxID=1567108 RepID=A0ABW2DJZ5_9BACT|nr:hypothetical protein [Rufibacter roseus]
MNRIVIFMLLLLVACKSKEDQMAHESQALEQTIDSLNNANIDGTETTTGPPLDIKKELPSELKASLNQRQGKWELPTLTDVDAQRIPESEQGPYFLQADFNGDQRTDYAVQIVRNDSASVIVYIKKDKGGDWEEHVLQRNALQNIGGKNRSLYYLSLAKKDGKYYDYSTQKNLIFPNDAVSVGAENYTATYVYENGKFKKYEAGD